MTTVKNMYTAIIPHLVGKFPDISQADRRTSQCGYCPEFRAKTISRVVHKNKNYKLAGYKLQVKIVKVQVNYGLWGFKVTLVCNL